MERTTEREKPEGPAGANGDRPESTGQAKARAYLDLWEQHVVQTALYGPVTAWPPKKS